MSAMRRLLLRRLRHQALGLVFLVMVALFLSTTIAVYNKAFSDAVPVRLTMDRLGTQMRTGADVKIHGVRVGEVRDVGTDGDGAELELAIEPDSLERIPASVTARLLPKTLFGERYVALQPPEGGGTGHLRAGDVIRQDRSAEAVEVEQLLSETLPLLEAVQPQKVSSTLNAMSTALSGRGQQLGETVTDLAGYLERITPSLPDMKADISALADAAESWDRAAPAFLDAMADATTTTRTLLQKRQQLGDLYASVRSAAGNLGGFLEANEDNLIRLTTTSQEVLDILAKYAPQYPCMFGQFAGSVPAAERAFGHGTDERNHVVIRFIARDRGKYVPGRDDPEYNDTRGPRCYPQVPAPGKWPQQPPGGPLKDGSSHPDTPQDDNPLPGPVKGLDVPFEDSSGTDGGGSNPGAGWPANSPAEQALVSLLQAPTTGIAPGEAPGWTSLLLGPLYRGTTVELR
ncbi:MCE family protein [Saccharomonospora halophila]|uniref:MCE family protein n=1 Tax=Saccharomonospora halophila TaxID=129922 RepID=UPI00037B0B40|nr:MCE family protein [Saccharomonospora halophila]